MPQPWRQNSAASIFVRASSYKRYPIKGLDIAVLIVSIALIAIGFLF